MRLRFLKTIRITPSYYISARLVARVSNSNYIVRYYN